MQARVDGGTVLLLQYYRQRRGWSQKTLGHLIGVDQAEISYIERERRTPSEQRLEALASVLGVWPAFTLLRRIKVQEEAVFADSDERVSS